MGKIPGFAVAAAGERMDSRLTTRVLESPADEAQWREPSEASLQNSSGQLSYFLVALTTVVVPILGLFAAGISFWHQGISAVDLSLAIVMYLVTVLGVELGFHRYLTHRSLKTTPALRALMTVCGCMAAHGPPIWWVAIHRRHHNYSDHDGDPHSPNLHGETLWQQLKGGWHSHVAWMFRPRYTAAHAAHFAKDLLGDRTLVAIDRWYAFWVVLGLAIPAGLGGWIGGTWAAAWTALLWGGLVRMFVGQHALWWGIVTVCHRYGTRPFQSNDDSKNNVLIAVLFLGDGWHNNHHAFPSSARVGLRWWEADFTWWVIRGLERCGLVWDVKVPSSKAIGEKLVGVTPPSGVNTQM
jgi:stearoyl-CoA desaturase (delta-9 desaturase)